MVNYRRAQCIEWIATVRQQRIRITKNVYCKSSKQNITNHQISKHRGGIRHVRAVNKETFYLHHCKISYPCRHNWESHIGGKLLSRNTRIKDQGKNWSYFYFISFLLAMFSLFILRLLIDLFWSPKNRNTFYSRKNFYQIYRKPQKYI